MGGESILAWMFFSYQSKEDFILDLECFILLPVKTLLPSVCCSGPEIPHSLPPSFTLSSVLIELDSGSSVATGASRDAGYIYREKDPALPDIRSDI